MNMILHGIEAPNIIHTNTLSENIADIQEKDRFDVILANPPFGGKERAELTCRGATADRHGLSGSGTRHPAATRLVREILQSEVAQGFFDGLHARL